jgi:hypothetical protein
MSFKKMKTNLSDIQILSQKGSAVHAAAGPVLQSAPPVFLTFRALS